MNDRVFVCRCLPCTLHRERRMYTGTRVLSDSAEDESSFETMDTTPDAEAVEVMMSRYEMEGLS